MMAALRVCSCSVVWYRVKSAGVRAMAEIATSHNTSANSTQRMQVMAPFIDGLRVDKGHHMVRPLTQRFGRAALLDRTQRRISYDCMKVAFEVTKAPKDGEAAEMIGGGERVVEEGPDVADERKV